MLTSVANDYGFERVFARQIEALGVSRRYGRRDLDERRPRPTCWRRCESARARGLTTIALTGRDGGEAGTLAEIHINVPDDRDRAGAGSAPDVDSRHLRDRGRRLTHGNHRTCRT